MTLNVISAKSLSDRLMQSCTDGALLYQQYLWIWP